MEHNVDYTITQARGSLWLDNLQPPMYGLLLENSTSVTLMLECQEKMTHSQQADCQNVSAL